MHKLLNRFSKKNRQKGGTRATEVAVRFWRESESRCARVEVAVRCGRRSTTHGRMCVTRCLISGNNFEIDLKFLSFNVIVTLIVLS